MFVLVFPFENPLTRWFSTTMYIVQFLPDSTMVQNGTREENFFAKKHTAEDVRSNTHIIIIGNTISLGFLACNTYSTDCATGVHKHVMSAEGRANLHVMRKN